MKPAMSGQLNGTFRVALTSLTVWLGSIVDQHGYHTLLFAIRHLAGVANLMPPKSCQRQLCGTGNCGPRASTTDRGDRVNVPSTRLASGPRAVTSTCKVGAR